MYCPLPTIRGIRPSALKRSSTVSDPGSANCPYCEEGVRGSTWHLLAECQHPQLIVARTRATQQLRRVVVELAERADPHARGEWSDGFGTVTDGGGLRWAPPQHWQRAEDRKAGVGAIPWYGCFPTAWLDNWGARYRPGQESKPIHWARGRRVLGRISDAAVQGCYQIWRTVTDLWKAEEQAAGRQRRGVAASRRIDSLSFLVACTAVLHSISSYSSR